MNIVSIEPTPSPNSMKIVLDTELPMLETHNYKKEDASSAPEPVAQLLKITGIKGIYHVMNFMAIERAGNVQWETILAEVRQVFNEGNTVQTEVESAAAESFGEVYVHVQTYKEIPLQVKVFDSESEQRFALSERFLAAMEQVHSAEVENYILLRKWADYGIRYGSKEEIGETIVKEVEAAYPEERLTAIVASSLQGDSQGSLERKKVSLADFETEEWETRFRLLDQMADPTVEDLPLLDCALSDEKMSIRRLAAVYLGMIESLEVVPYIEKALQDKSWAVRRTAGDCMSDLGFPEFEPAARVILKDKNKLVRWRAAMFLYETGTEESLPALRQAAEDSEFEVKLQIQMAIERIDGGEDAKGSIWKQMTELRSATK
ncbi:virulence factor [Sporosarcina gallistercoris]|uniref:virulence factor n=1 Tax=Sporosarcina gallistercoris TaxID=2762245 RepID=UPI003D29070B